MDLSKKALKYKQLSLNTNGVAHLQRLVDRRQSSIPGWQAQQQKIATTHLPISSASTPPTSPTAPPTPPTPPVLRTWLSTNAAGSNSTPTSSHNRMAVGPHHRSTGDQNLTPIYHHRSFQGTPNAPVYYYQQPRPAVDVPSPISSSIPIRHVTEARPDSIGRPERSRINMNTSECWGSCGGHSVAMAEISEEQNCSLLVKYIPGSATALDVFRTVTHGQIVDYFKSPVIQGSCSARIVFADRISAVVYKRRGDMSGIRIRGQFVMVLWNEHRVGPYKSSRNTTK